MWHNERLGLTVIFSSLAVIVIIIALLFSSQRSAEEEQIRTHVGSLVQLMAKILARSCRAMNVSCRMRC